MNVRTVGARVLAGISLSIAALTLSTVASADELTITADKNPALAGEEVTFTFLPKVLGTGDIVTFHFGDETQTEIKYDVGCGLLGGCGRVKHAYAGAGIFTVTASGTIGQEPVSGTLEMTVTELPSENYLYIATAAHLPGYLGTQWRTDLEIHNYTLDQATYEIALLVRGQSNLNPQKVRFTLATRRAVRYSDALMSLFSFNGAAALQIIPVSGAVMSVSRTYNQGTAGTYGQYVPAIPRSEAIPFGKQARLIMLSHDPTLKAGFRTNLGLVNASPADISVDTLFYDTSGSLIGGKTYELRAYEYRQIDRVFEEVTPSLVSDGYISVEATTVGARFFAYASVVDNVTGDPIFVPAKIID